MRKSNFALRLQPSLLDEARHLAQAEGVALNQLINVAVAEKVSALRTEKYFAERAARGDNHRRAARFAYGPDAVYGSGCFGLRFGLKAYVL